MADLDTAIGRVLALTDDQWTYERYRLEREAEQFADPLAQVCALGTIDYLDDRRRFELARLEQQQRDRIIEDAVRRTR
jgi:hypothetical protein